MAEDKLHQSKEQAQSEATNIEEREDGSDDESAETETQPRSSQASLSTSYGPLEAPPQVPKRKGGRKPIYSTSEERKQRNRQAQAAFRTRRTDYIKNLEKEIEEQKKELQTLREGHRTAKDQCLMLSYKNALLERILTEKGIDVQAELESHNTGSFYRSGSTTSPQGGTSSVQRQTLIRPKHPKYKPPSDRFDTSKLRRFGTQQSGSSVSDTTSPQFSQSQRVFFQHSPSSSRPPSFGGTPVTPQQSHGAAFAHNTPQRHAGPSADNTQSNFQQSHFEAMGNEMHTQMSPPGVATMHSVGGPTEPGTFQGYVHAGAATTSAPNAGDDRSRPHLQTHLDSSSTEHRQSLSAHVQPTADYHPFYYPSQLMHQHAQNQNHDQEDHPIEDDGMGIGHDMFGLDASMNFPSNYS